MLQWIEQGLTSHQTHYRSYRGRVFIGQMTQPTVSKPVYFECVIERQNNVANGTRYHKTALDDFEW